MHSTKISSIFFADVPLSYGLIDARNDSNALNSAEFVWDPTKESGVYIKVNCISTEFTAKKHGGEKGVPFRLQIETFLHGDSSKLQHCASCQLKVFKVMFFTFIKLSQDDLTQSMKKQC